MTKALTGITVLNTRPKELAHELTELVFNHGGQCIPCPAIEIIPLETTWHTRLPTECDWVIFISQNAVTHSMERLKKHWKTFPPTASVGLKTTNLLNLNHIPVALTSEQGSSDSLLASPSLQHLPNKTVVVIKGVGGRPLLHNTLLERGANLINIDVYERQCPKSLPPACKNIWKNETKFIILGTSIESIENLFCLFGAQAKSWLQDTPWLVISERIKEKANSLGIKTVYLSKPDTLNDVLLGLKI